MNISFTFQSYVRYPEFYNELAHSMQARGNRVGVISGNRETERGKIERALGFKPNFMHLWGEFETISNGSKWKIEKMIQEEVLVHFDEEATELKKFTNLWVFKSYNPDAPKGF
jgi:hypothetical protein